MVSLEVEFERAEAIMLSAVIQHPKTEAILKRCGFETCCVPHFIKSLATEAFKQCQQELIAAVAEMPEGEFLRTFGEMG